MAISEFQPAPPKLALPLPHVRPFLAQLQQKDVQLPLQHADLPLGQLLLPAPEQLFLGLLLQGGPHELLLARPQLLPEAHRDHRRQEVTITAYITAPKPSVLDPTHSQRPCPLSLCSSLPQHPWELRVASALHI
jgi:hypothetical protein